jgi:sugar/nucleoside kinase (ribokinase family)
MLTLKVKAIPGSDIKDTFEKAITLAKKLDCYIEFDFNGVDCIAHPHGKAEEGERQYFIAITKEHGFAHCLV